MPHIIIKAIEGASHKQMEEASLAAIEAISKVLNKPKKYFSASFVNYSFEDWEQVYNEDIKDNEDIVVKPQYTNPKTFN